MTHERTIPANDGEDRKTKVSRTVLGRTPSRAVTDPSLSLQTLSVSG